MNFNVSAKEALNTVVQRSQVQKQDDDSITTWEKDKKNYDILILQKLWWFDDIFKTYCSVTVDFTLKNNEDRIYFYINKKIDSNIWYST